jgi:hypothetical protein
MADKGCACGHVHFVGSVPLADSKAVMQALGKGFGTALRRIPDGETGERINWLQFQEGVFARVPELERIEGDFDWRNATARKTASTQFRLRPGTSVNAASLGSLGFADSALASWRDFDALRREGVIAPGTRFMVALPSPYNVISWGIAPESRVAVEIAYEEALLNEVDAICRAIPHDALSIQWDCAHDMQAFDGARTPWFTPAREGIIERLARLGDRVPADVDLGYHLCYGSFGGRHFVEPKDAAAMVDLTNGVIAAISRPVQFVHMPVPVERDDDAFHAPLARLRLPAGTELYLGLIHDTDGAEGTARRIAAARRHVSDFGIATECGFGRRPADSVPVLIALHQEVLAGMDA